MEQRVTLSDFHALQATLLETRKALYESHEREKKALDKVTAPRRQGTSSVNPTKTPLPKGPFALPKPIHVYSEMHSSGDKLYTLGLWKLPFEGWGVDGPISAGRGKVESLSAAALG